jgi:hypothetical protein
MAESFPILTLSSLLDHYNFRVWWAFAAMLIVGTFSLIPLLKQAELSKINSFGDWNPRLVGVLA